MRQLLHRARQFLDDHRRETFRRFVHQQHARIADERAADRQHLLLAARQLVAAVLGALGQTRKQVEHGLVRPRPRPRSDIHVLAHRQRRENLTFLRYQPQASRHPPVGRGGGNILAAQRNAAAMQIGVAHDGRQQRRFADAVAANDRDGLAGLKRKIDVFQHHGFAIAGEDLVELEDRVDGRTNHDRLRAGPRHGLPGRDRPRARLRCS